ncbi:MAG: response regulator transcription factor [Burkholderiales bacterium]
MVPLLLIVEDNEFSRKMIATALNKRRYLFAKTGKEALEIYFSNRPNIVFLDILLPDMSGLELLRIIKEKDSAAFIVMLSANSEREIVVQSIRGGAKGFIVKPFSKAKIDEYINKYMQIHQSNG